MDDSGSQPSEDEQRWARLTDKQRACLDLLLEHLTSKQIARRLGISKHTVDQRLAGAREILGASDRSEAAFIYGQLKPIYDRMTYDAVQVPRGPVLVRSEFANGDAASLLELHDSAKLSSGSASSGLPFRDLWRHDHSSARRMAIMTAMLAAIVLILLGGLGIAQALNQLFSD